MSSNKVIQISGLGKQYNNFWALKDVDLTIRRGEKVAILGPNGAGKTTLLKIIAGIIQPTVGSVYRQGKIVSLSDLEAGFHPELTGLENITLNGMLVGMSREEVLAKKESIINLANIGEFINLPFYQYSSGMKFRLAFAVAIFSNCEVLILDEVFVAGDHSFQLESIAMIQNIQSSHNLTIIISSHILAYVVALSNKYYSLSKGKLFKLSNQQVKDLIKYEAKMWKKSIGLTFNIKAPY